MVRRRRVAIVIVHAVAVGATVAWVCRRDFGAAWTTPFALALLAASIWLLVVATAVMFRWRPASRLWMMMAALSVVRSWFVVAIMTAVGGSGLFNPRVLARPILYLLLLSWPSGHLRSADRIWWTAYSILQAVLLWIVPQVLQDADGRPFVVADVPALVEIASSFGLALVLPVGSVVLYVTIRRHAAALPPAGRWLHRPIVVAAAVTMTSELILVASVVSESGFDESGRPGELGGLFLIANYLPYAVTPILAMVAVRRAQASANQTTSIEIGPADEVLRSLVGAARVAGVDVRFAGQGGRWLDHEGRDVAAPTASATVIEIRRDHEVLATVATDGAVSPDDVERIVAATGASVDFSRLAAAANASRRSASDARQAMVDARAMALERLELDLHDGAQQRLVGLALQASMARRLRRDDDGVAQDLRAGLDVARQQIAEAASGLFPTVVGARGLEASIANLAACSDMSVEVDVDLPPALPAEIAAAAWFVAAEAVANATKHAGATRLRIVGSVRVVDDGRRRLDMVIDDDGCGGADLNGSGLVGLRARVERFGGELDVSSPTDAGTVVRAGFPLPSCEPVAP